jgi:hypothetical protein
MGRYTDNHIENPDAYARAIQGSIHARATAKRYREWSAAYPELAAWYTYDGTPRDEEGNWINRPYVQHPAGQFPPSFRDSLDKWGSLHPNGSAALAKIYADRLEKNAKREEEKAAERANATPWTAGRQVVEGEVLSVKHVDNDFGGSLKMLVKRADGSKIWTTVPSDLLAVDYDVPVEDRPELKGARVRFTVTVEPSQDDPIFAFGKRPSKATRL